MAASDEQGFSYNCFSAREQLEFLENRKKQYMKAAVKAKKENNLEQAKMYLRTAKSFDLKIEQAKCGKPVDISKVSNTVSFLIFFIFLDMLSTYFKEWMI